MTTYHDLTGFQRDLLEAIAAVDDDPYGLALKEYLDERYADPSTTAASTRISTSSLTKDWSTGTTSTPAPTCIR